MEMQKCSKQFFRQAMSEVSVFVHALSVLPDACLDTVGLTTSEEMATEMTADTAITRHCDLDANVPAGFLRNLSQEEALSYHLALSTEYQTPPTACYCIRCVPLGGCPIGVSLNLNLCGDCIYPVSTLPFSCCMCMPRASNRAFTNLRHTAQIAVVDTNYTITFHEVMYCCYCTKW